MKPLSSHASRAARSRPVDTNCPTAWSAWKERSQDQVMIMMVLHWVADLELHFIHVCRAARLVSWSSSDGSFTCSITLTCSWRGVGTAVCSLPLETYIPSLQCPPQLYQKYLFNHVHWVIDLALLKPIWRCCFVYRSRRHYLERDTIWCCTALQIERSNRRQLLFLISQWCSNYKLGINLNPDYLSLPGLRLGDLNPWTNGSLVNCCLNLWPLGHWIKQFLTMSILCHSCSSVCHIVEQEVIIKFCTGV